MFRLRLAILGAAAALALGTASALAMQESTGTGDPDAHGDAVASAARNCPHGANGVHGACVSAIASSESQDNNQTDTGASSQSPAQICKAADASENAAETAPAKGDKAAKAKDHSEDKSEHKAFAACVSGQSAAEGS